MTLWKFLMFNILEQFKDEFNDNPFVSFDSSGHGVSRIFDDKWDFVSLRGSERYVHFISIPKPHRQNIQSYTAKLIKIDIEKSTDNHISVSKMNRTKKNLWAISSIWGKSDFSLLSNDIEWRNVKEALIEKKSVTMLKQICTTLKQLTNAELLER